MNEHMDQKSLPIFPLGQAPASPHLVSDGEVDADLGSGTPHCTPARNSGRLRRFTYWLDNSLIGLGLGTLCLFFTIYASIFFGGVLS